MSGALFITRGYSAPEAEQNCLRARDLCEGLGDPSERVPVLFNLWLVSLMGRRNGPIQDYARQLMEAARTQSDPLHEIPARCAHASTLFFLGRLQEARAEFHQILQRYSVELHPALARIYGEDHGLYAQVFLAWLLLLMGDVEQAREVIAHSHVLAEQMRDPLAESIVCNYTSNMYFLLREPEQAREYAERCWNICQKHGFHHYQGQSVEWIGWSLAMGGKTEEGLQEIDRGLAFFDAIQQRLPLSYYLTIPIEVHLKVGDHARGLNGIERALQCAETNLDRFYLPELYRLKGELLRAAGAPTGVVLDWFERALAQARESGAAFLELRAARSLAGLLTTREDTARARELLTTALGKLRGGEDTRDCREARQLLESLSP
jgi:tetratricopeptide (TPR) repeat protein